MAEWRIHDFKFVGYYSDGVYVSNLGGQELYLISNLQSEDLTLTLIRGFDGLVTYAGMQIFEDEP
jgi:hypothetical protein